jgi:epoxyqueuosine reductase QueG
MQLLDELKARTPLEIIGVADAQAYGKKAPEGHRPCDYLKESRSILLIGTRLLDLPIDKLPATRAEYTADFHIANSRLNNALFDIASCLQEAGYRVFPIPYTEMPGWNLDKRSPLMLKTARHFFGLEKVKNVLNQKVLWANLSYRHMAVEAGLGSIGINNLLITPQYGPRVRFVALLTDAELEPGNPLGYTTCDPDRCGLACVRSCPVNALKSDGSSTNKAACLKYYIKLGVPGMSGVRCGLCVGKCRPVRSVEKG